MEGRRFAFGRYRRGDHYEPFVCLWGTEQEFRDPNADDHDIYTERNTFLWCWWRTPSLPADSSEGAEG